MIQVALGGCSFLQVMYTFFTILQVFSTLTEEKVSFLCPGCSMCGLPACSNLPRTQFASCCPFPRNTGFSNPNLIKFFKVLNLWIMDQVPIGNKTPRPGYARQIWCPACRGLLETPLALTSGHVLLDCMVVEGTCQSKFSPCTSTALLLVQVHACVKGSDLSWMSARQQGEVKNLPTLCMSMVLIQ